MSHTNRFALCISLFGLVALQTSFTFNAVSYGGSANQPEQSSGQTPRATRQKCGATVKTSVRRVKGEGQGCTKEDAKRAALINIGSVHCKDSKNPACAGNCDSGQSCNPVAQGGTRRNFSFEAVEMAGCEGGRGWKCVAQGSFDCACRCQ